TAAVFSWDRAVPAAGVLSVHRRANLRASGNGRWCVVQLLDGKAGSGLVLGHELIALSFWHDIVDIVEFAGAAFIDDIEQAKGTGPAIAQHQLRNRTAELPVIIGK